MMLRTRNAAGTFIYPLYKIGQLDTAHQDKEALVVFVPDGRLPGGDWACTISGHGGSAVVETLEEMAKLITALEIAYERAKDLLGGE